MTPIIIHLVVSTCMCGFTFESSSRSLLVCKSRMEIAVRITEITVIFSDLKNAVKCSKFCDYLYH